MSHMTSHDPDFEEKAADIIGLYLHPPQHAVVFCVDEITYPPKVQDRLDPLLPLPPHRGERRGDENYRYGALSLYAAFNARTCDPLGRPAPRHTAAEFFAFLTDAIVDQPRGKEIHVIADNLSAHTTLHVQDLLPVHPTVYLHFVPTYSSWLKQVDFWLKKVERDVMSRGTLPPVTHLKTELTRYIRQHNRHLQILKWRYGDALRPIRTYSAGTVQ